MQPRFPSLPLAIAFALTVLAVVVMAAVVLVVADRTRTAEAERSVLERLRGDVLVLDEVLTMSAHMAAATGEPEWEARYRYHEPKLRAALDLGQTLAPDPAGTVATARANDDLVALEDQALGFARRGDLAAARAVLASRPYVERKIAFAKGISHLVARLDEARATSEAVEIGVSRALSSASVLAVAAALLTWTLAYRAVRRWRSDVEVLQRSLTETREALTAANANLEAQVADRTRLAEARAREVERLAHEVVEVESLERQRLSRILHDHLQQLLVGARLQLGLQTEVRGADAYGKRADRLLEEAADVSRSLAVQLDPPVDLSAGLGEALRWLVRWVYETHHVQVTLDLQDEPQGMAPEVCGLAVHAVRELLFNVVKHAQVSEAYVQVTIPEAGWVRLRVEDAGVGFLPQSDRAPVGLGLAGMQRRIRGLGGRLVLHAAPGAGVEAILDLPTGSAPSPLLRETPLPPPALCAIVGDHREDAGCPKT